MLVSWGIVIYTTNVQKISLICTVFNESETIQDLLESVLIQTYSPGEVIIVDGGSSDDTVKKIKDFAKRNPKLNLRVEIKNGNRSIGRNYAIKISQKELIAITDAGCVLDKNWLAELVKEYEKNNQGDLRTPVIAGYYAAGGTSKESNQKQLTDFQKAVVPYALVMPDKVNLETFLPATRSMLIEKKLFERLSSFDEKYSDNEDYVFSKKLEKQKIKIAFAKNAVVFWTPRKTLKDFYTMIFRFARGDIFAGIVRPKVVLIFVRYIVFIFLIILNTKLFLALMCFYAVWAIQKNKKYVGEGWKYLPPLQFTSDVAVMHGSMIGFFKK